jgi:hypothetical protein
MTNAVRYLATGSILALMSVLSLPATAAEGDGMQRPSMQDNDSMRDNNCVGVDCMPESKGETDRVQKPDGSNTGKMKGDSDKRRNVNRNDGGKDGVDRKREARSDWKYDSNRHKRNRNKDARYRYYYGGYWYLEPYWTGPVNSRVSCGEGREIINDSGFNRVRTIECSGRNYTYAARRHGDNFRVGLNSRTGEIVSVRPM